jgi:hypothetical protein
VAADLEVDAPLGGVELDVIDDPRRLQAQRAGEQRFYGNASWTHPPDASWTTPPVDMWTGQEAQRPAHMPTGLDYQEHLSL